MKMSLLISLLQPSFSLLVNSQTHIFTHLPDYMPVNILISPYTQRIKLVHHTNKIIKFGICFPQFGRCERMSFRPVWATIVPNGDRLESSEESAVWDRKSVWPVGGVNAVPQRKWEGYHLYWIIPTQQVGPPKAGLSHISSPAVTRISMGKCGRMPFGSSYSSRRYSRNSVRKALAFL